MAVKIDGAIQMVTQLSNNMGILRDTRVLEENGKVMHVNLLLQMADGRHIVINRYFIKSNLTCEELLEQAESGTIKRYALCVLFILSPREEDFDSD